MESKSFPICTRCLKPIEDAAYIHIIPTIVLRDIPATMPVIFKCREQAENYAKTMDFHDDCWMLELKDHKIPYTDLTELAKKLKQGD